MMRSHRLARVARAAGLLEDAATRALARQRRGLSEAEAKLKLLAGYRDEYLARLRQAPEGFAAAQIRDYHVFLYKLDEALAGQRAEVARQRTDYEAKRSDWYAARRRAAATERLAERSRAAEARHAVRNEGFEAEERRPPHDEVVE